MIQVLLPDDAVRALPFYLAMEEYLADKDGNDYFFMWQVEPTVIIGRNQNILKEVNIDYCKTNGIDVVRRKSGGGCVYADMKNVMFSYITSSATVTDTFSSYTSQVAKMLVALGVPATVGGRNDILIGDRKVSGNAFYHRHGRAIVHGTMLYDSDVEAMSQAITPSDVKLISRGVDSVRTRVINLREVINISLNEFKREAARLLCESQLRLDERDVMAIEAIARNYTTPHWLYGNIENHTAATTTRVDGVGEFQVSVTLESLTIADIHLTGDFFLLSDIDSTIIDKLKGVPYSRRAISAALSDIDVSTVIASMSNEQFVNILI